MGDTKKCPHCGEEIKANAKKCRFCGEWVDGSAPQVTREVRTSAERNGNSGNNGNVLKYIVIGITVLVVAIIAVVLISKTDDSRVKAETSMSDTIPPAAEPYTIDQVEATIAEYDANETPEEKAKEPWRIHLDKLQGSYLIDRVSTAADIYMVHNYGKYVISGNTITKYEWSESSNSWTPKFSSEFQLFKFQEGDYMTGYNLIYTDQYGNECRMCSGDVNGDGVMDLWQSDSVFWTKQ